MSNDVVDDQLRRNVLEVDGEGGRSSKKMGPTLVAIGVTALVASLLGVLGGAWLLSSVFGTDSILAENELESTVEQSSDGVTSPAEPSVPVAAPVDAGPVATLTATLTSGQFEVSGRLPDPALLAAVRETAASMYGPDFEDALVEDASLPLPGWSQMAANLVVSLPIISNGGFVLDGDVVTVWGTAGSVESHERFKGAVQQMLGPDVELVDNIEIVEKESPRLFIRKTDPKTIDMIGVVPDEGVRAVIEQTLAAIFTDHTINSDLAVDPAVLDAFVLYSLPRFAGLFVDFPVWEVRYSNSTFSSTTPGAATFEVDSAELASLGVTILDSIAVAMSGIPGIHLVVEGHPDSDGSATYNLELSNQRAQTVIDYLVTTHGIDPARLSAVGYGEERPIADNSDADGRTANRRVDVIISTPENL